MKQNSPLSRALLLAGAIFCSTLALFALPGCAGKSGGPKADGGGGGGGGGGTTSNPSFTIRWPERSRSSLDHGLSSAVSVRVTLEGASTGGANVTTVANRDAARLGAYTANYTMGSAVRSGSASVLAVFYSSSNGTGNEVGRATGSVNLQGTLDFATINPIGKITQVTVAPVTIALDSGVTQLVASARDVDGALVGISPGSVLWTRLSGTGVLSLSRDGLATPSSEGTANVTAAIDGIVSAAGVITVGPAAPPAGTVRLQSGPILTATGRSAVAVTGQKLARTFRLVRADGTEESIPNAHVFRNLGVNDEVVVVRAGTQLIKGTFTDPSRRFLAWDDFPQNYVPITADGVLLNSVVWPRLPNMDVQTISPFEVDGQVIQSLWFGPDFSSSLPQNRVLPLEYRIDIPRTGQPSSLLRGFIRYPTEAGLHGLEIRVSRSVRGGYGRDFILQNDGSLQFSNAAGSTELVQGEVNVALGVSLP